MGLVWFNTVLPEDEVENCVSDEEQAADEEDE